jgi:hypothetical protein
MDGQRQRGALLRVCTSGKTDQNKTIKTSAGHQVQGFVFFDCESLNQYQTLLLDKYRNIGTLGSFDTLVIQYPHRRGLFLLKIIIYKLANRSGKWQVFGVISRIGSKIDKKHQNFNRFFHASLVLTGTL